MEALVHNLIYITGLISIGVTWLFMSVLGLLAISLIRGMYDK